MASNINASVPSGPVAYTADMRNNFAIAGAEIGRASCRERV